MDERKPMGKPLENATTHRKESGKPARLSREMQARLGQQLRAMYDEVVNQGVPDRFFELLNRIDRNGSKDGQ
jgi:anti-sigma factor NepR-like protein